MSDNVRLIAAELLKRRKARSGLFDYIKYTKRGYKESLFALMVCAALDQFLKDVEAGLRPILILQAPPQHGKSEIVSRKLPAYIMGKFPNWRLVAASYADDLAGTMALDVRRTLESDEHKLLFPPPDKRQKFKLERNGDFSNPNGDGSYFSVGIGGGLTGRPADIGIIDDPIKNDKEALSETKKASDWNWYQSVFTSRLSENSGQIIMATSWAQDDLAGRIMEHFAGDRRLTVLRFPAINDPDDVGYNPMMPLGALVPELHSLQKLLETKALFSEYWWSAMYQQSPKALGGNVFKEEGIHHYLPKDLPAKFDKMINSWDCTFKDTDGTDFVVGIAMAKKGSKVYLLDLDRDRRSFTKTVGAVLAMRTNYPLTREVLIEDKANGPAVIDTLKDVVPGLLAIEPDGSKLARAHAITSYWEAGDIYLPDPSIAKWVRPFLAELTAFPASANDDQVDAFTQGVRRLLGGFQGFKVPEGLLSKLAGGAGR